MLLGRENLLCYALVHIVLEDTLQAGQGDNQLVSDLYGWDFLHLFFVKVELNLDLFAVLSQPNRIIRCQRDQEVTSVIKITDLLRDSIVAFLESLPVLFIFRFQLKWLIPRQIHFPSTASYVQGYCLLGGLGKVRLSFWRLWFTFIIIIGGGSKITPITLRIVTLRAVRITLAIRRVRVLLLRWFFLFCFLLLDFVWQSPQHI